MAHVQILVHDTNTDPIQIENLYWNISQCDAYLKNYKKNNLQEPPLFISFATGDFCMQ
jgi:hypothetical protein